MMNNKISRDCISFLIPQQLLDISKHTIPAPEEINAWKDLEERKLYLNSGVDEGIIDYLGYYIDKFNDADEVNNVAVEDRLPIKIFINTNGGDLAATMYVCDLIINSKTPVWTYGQANAWSAGGLLLIAGHKRFCWKHTTFLLHSGSFGLEGDVDSVKDTMNFVSEIEKDVEEYVLTQTKITKAIYKKNYRKQWFMRSEEMLKFGLVDEIIGGKK